MNFVLTDTHTYIHTHIVMFFWWFNVFYLTARLKKNQNVFVSFVLFNQHKWIIIIEWTSNSNLMKLTKYSCRICLTQLTWNPQSKISFLTFNSVFFSSVFFVFFLSNWNLFLKLLVNYRFCLVVCKPVIILNEWFVVMLWLILWRSCLNNNVNKLIRYLYGGYHCNAMFLIWLKNRLISILWKISSKFFRYI